MSIFIILFNIVYWRFWLEQLDKKLKYIQIVKKEVKLSICRLCDLNIENPKEYIHTNTKHGNKSAELQDIISIYRNQLYFYTLSINNPEMKLRE